MPARLKSPTDRIGPYPPSYQAIPARATGGERPADSHAIAMEVRMA